jgi:hypothetical protein
MDVQTAEPAENLLEHGLDIGGAPDICVDGESAASNPFDGGGGRIGPGPVRMVVHPDIASQARQFQRDPFPDSFACSGDQGRPALKIG